ncbi:MAG: hypothetical protein IIU83_09740 [Fibrobacteraceae bacterium]|nr:hypothetical protein [Fibrobacteraceae bacterium]
MSLVKELAHNLPAVLTHNLPATCHATLVIAMERSDRSNRLANRSPHCVRDDNPELVIAMERSDRSNLFANRSPHCVRDDNSHYIAMTSCLYTCDDNSHYVCDYIRPVSRPFTGS